MFFIKCYYSKGWLALPSTLIQIVSSVLQLKDKTKYVQGRNKMYILLNESN